MLGEGEPGGVRVQERVAGVAHLLEEEEELEQDTHAHCEHQEALGGSVVLSVFPFEHGMRRKQPGGRRR